MTQINDGMQSLVTGMGTDRDKAASVSYVAETISPTDLLAAYRGSSVARAIVDKPAVDSCREWRAWQAEDSQITALEAEEKRLGLQGMVLRARKRARLFGGSAIYIGTTDSDLSEPLNPERIGAGGIQYLTLLDRMELAPGDIQRDPTQSGYGLPAWYSITPAMGGGSLRIHPSRLAIFHGDELPSNDLTMGGDGWGDSVLQVAIDKVRHLDSTVANVASLVFEAKVDVIQIEDFTKNLRELGAKYEEMMLARFALAKLAKGNNGMLLLDSKEEYSQKSANFSTLPDIVTTFQVMVTQAADIPMSELFERTSGGLNTGGHEADSYHERISREQALEMEPALAVLDECLIRSALGSRPPEVHFNWRPLAKPDAKDQADIATKITSAAKTLYEIDALSPEALAKATVNALTESGAFPGLEAAVTEFPQLGDFPDIPEGDDLEAMGGKPSEVSDAAPRTLYVSRKVVNASDLIEWAKGQGFKTTLPADDLHVTIAYSRSPLDWMKVGETYAEKVTVSAGGPRIMEAFGANGEAKVLQFASNELVWRHEDIKRAGASWDWPDFQPHITISYDPDAPDVTQIEPYRGEIVLGPEIFAEVNENWKEGVSEE